MCDHGSGIQIHLPQIMCSNRKTTGEIFIVMEQSRKSEHFKYIRGNTWLPGKQGNVCLRSQVLPGAILHYRVGGS